jgi:hypothetical protein
LDRRVAVLPFADRHEGDHPSAVPLAILVDALPILGDPSAAADQGASILRARVHAELAARTRFELVPLPAVDTGLAAAGFDAAALHSLDAPGRAAARRLGEATGADTLVFGDVTAWRREFWGLQSHATVGLALELRDAATGARLFSAEGEDTEHSGLSQVPLPLATEPLEVPAWVFLELLRGLSNSVFLRLADDVAALSVGGLSSLPADGADATVPFIDQVAVSAAGPLATGDLLVVVARGTPGALAAFRVGPGGWITMAECAAGTYRGSAVTPPTGWPAGRIVVRLLGEAHADEVELLGPTVSGGAP